MKDWTILVGGALGLIGCSDISFLDSGDSLIASITPAPIYTSSGGDPCSNGEAAKVHLIANHSDGNAAEKALVQLWLTGPATLSEDTVRLSKDGTSDSVCIVPLDTPGMVTLHARSGPIETTAMVEVRSRVVPAGGSLSLTASPPASASPTPASSCGDAMPTGCIPGQRRQSQISIQGAPSEALPLPDRAELWLDTNVGWLSADPCTAVVGSATLKIKLVGGATTAYACFPDLGGTATLTARSGTVTQSTQVELRAIPRSVLLASTVAVASSGAPVSFTAIAYGCDDQGIANVPLAFEVMQGAFDVDAGGSLLVKTGADGTAKLSGTARTVPLTVKVKVLGASQVSCQASVAESMVP